MPATLTLTRSEPYLLRLVPISTPVSDEEFLEFCRLNPEWRIERTAKGELIIMPPTGGKTGRQNSELNRLLGNWAESEGTGVVFGSSTAFSLPSGARRSPDLSWVRRSRWEALTEKEREEFPPICPDFVAELRSPTDSVATLQAKMEEYLANGAQLGWLIDPIEKRVYVYRPGAQVTCLEHPTEMAGDPVLPGFVLDLDRIWS